MNGEFLEKSQVRAHTHQGLVRLCYNAGQGKSLEESHWGTADVAFGSFVIESQG